MNAPAQASSAAAEVGVHVRRRGKGDCNAALARLSAVSRYVSACRSVISPTVKNPELPGPSLGSVIPGKLAKPRRSRTVLLYSRTLSLDSGRGPALSAGGSFARGAPLVGVAVSTDRGVPSAAIDPMQPASVKARLPGKAWVRGFMRDRYRGRRKHHTGGAQDGSPMTRHPLAICPT